REKRWRLAECLRAVAARTSLSAGDSGCSEHANLRDRHPPLWATPFMREHRRIRLPTPPRRWAASETRLLGHYADRELASRFDRPKNQAAMIGCGSRFRHSRPTKAGVGAEPSRRSSKWI